MTKQNFQYDISFTQNREISWLKFNERVLDEASDPLVPIYERLKFISIFTSNLDEFFMIRVGSLYDLSLLKETHLDNKCGLTPQEQLDEIFLQIPPLYRKRNKIFQSVEKELRAYDIYNLNIKELETKEKKYIAEYFREYISPVLSPQIMDSHHPFPHLVNKSLNIAVRLRGNRENLYGIIPVPRSVPRVIFLPGSTLRYVLAEKVIAEYAEAVFDMYEVIEKTVLSVTRNADINPDDEAYDVEEDYRYHMRKILKKRSRLAPVRLETRNAISEEFSEYLCAKLKITRQQVLKSSTPLDMSYVFSLSEKFSAAVRNSITYEPFTPQPLPGLTQKDSMIRQILKKDILLSYPYEKMKPFLDLLREASTDPNVISIKITIYRLAGQSKLVEHLITAAENNKDVTVLMELRARFDEQNNIDWSERLEEAGCRVIYGFDGFKVHSKICLITRRDKGRIQYITQIGTGNYNEKTAKLYTDFSLMTADLEIGEDANSYFKNMAISNLDGQYEHLLVAPNGLKSGIMKLIGEETKKAATGGKGNIFMKMNSLTDREIIDKLSEASRAGVHVSLVIRGICCLLPGIEGKTEHISVTSIVGRFLEHSRIYCFGSGAEMKLYISSADMMTRNTQRRVEIACPVFDRACRLKVLEYIDTLLRDNVKARRLNRDGTYTPVNSSGGERLDAQAYLMQKAIADADDSAEVRSSAKRFFQTLSERFHKHKI